MKTGILFVLMGISIIFFLSMSQLVRDAPRAELMVPLVEAESKLRALEGLLSKIRDLADTD